MKTDAPKVHAHLVKKICEAVLTIFQEGRPADKVIEFYLKSEKKWGARDRRFFAENVYEIVRWYRYYIHILGIHQIESLYDVESMFLLRFYSQYQALPAGYQPEDINLKDWDRKIANRPNILRAVRESIPDWMDQLAEGELGERWAKILPALNEAAPVDLRVNRLKSTPEKVQQELEKEGIDNRPLSGQTEDFPDTLTLTHRKNVFVTQAFKDGHFEVQDRASQLVAPFTQVEPGMRVVDACAGAGGKTLHLAALMKNKGKIIAMDITERKLEELQKRARRNGVHIVETKVIDSTKVIKRLEESADRVLMDVPCSGFGVLRRNPDSKWKLSYEKVRALNELQAQLLKDYAKMVKPGGKLIYSTCSILPSENELQVEKFLAENPHFTLEDQRRIDPDQGKGDGFFMARMKKV